MKKILSILLAVTMLVGVLAAAPFTVSASDGGSTTVSFDTSSTTWKSFKHVYCYIWSYQNGEFYAWSTKKTRMTDEDGDGIYSYDLAANGITLNDEEDYGVIFSDSNGNQTYDLLIGNDCLGDTAYCDGTHYENPLDSEKFATAAFWKGQNPEHYGPILSITSIGNVVGTCMRHSIDAQSMLKEFLIYTLDNAREYSGNNDQQIIDNIAAALDLSVEDIQTAIADSERDDIEWSPADEAEADPDALIGNTTGDMINFNALSTGWRGLSMVYAYICEYNGDSFFPYGDKKTKMSDPDGDGIWSYSLTEKGITLDSGKSYTVVFSDNNNHSTYMLTLGNECIGDTAYSNNESGGTHNGSGQYIYWQNQSREVYGPLLQINALGDVEGYCLPKGVTAYDLLLEYLASGTLEYSIEYTGKTGAEIVEGIAATLMLTDEEAARAVDESGVDLETGTVKPAGYGTGDVNGDGTVDAKDRIKLTRYLAKWTGYKNIDMEASDVNCDESVDAKDRIILTRYLAKWAGYDALPLAD